MLLNLAIILAPLFIGYAILCNNEAIQRKINSLLMILIYFILFVMGCELAQLDDLLNNLPLLIQSTALLFGLSFGLNFVVLAILDGLFPWQYAQVNEKKESYLSLLLESGKIASVILIGFIIGFIFPSLFLWQYNAILSKSALILMLFLIGIQLRTSKISFKQVLMSKIGIMTTAVVMVTCLIGGVIFSFLIDVPMTQGVAMASGYGFYSLSGILIKESYGPIMGNITLLNDILREVLAILLIPIFAKRLKYTTLGISGATSMDFTLPMITKNGGVPMVAPAIVQGFLLTLFMPILVSILTNLH